MKCINGWTKELMINAIKLGNNGARCAPGYYDSCSYRGDNNNKCAVGVFIPDDLYDKSCEGNDVIFLLDKYHGLLEFMPLETRGLKLLQNVHDGTETKNNMHKVLINWINENVEE